MNNKHSFRISYLGFRPDNSFLLHRKLMHSQNHQQLNCSAQYGEQSVEPYCYHIQNLPRRQKNVVYQTENRPFQGMNPSIKDHSLLFDSSFQSGNLDIAVKMSAKQYDLFMKVDSNTLGHCNWYYFMVQAKTAGTYRFNICNFFRSKNLYRKGKLPYVFKVGTSTGWEQGGNFIQYKQEILKYQFIYKKLSHVPNLSKLSFTYQIQQNQTVYFAYCPPYPYSLLLKKIQKWEYSKSIKSYIFCKSQLGLSVPLLRIGKGSKIILITSRVHPGQSNSSYCLQGFVERLLSQQQCIQQTLEKVTFLIVPMINPDGVILGNFRTGATGKDLNRQFSDDSKCPQINALHHLYYRLTKAGCQFIVYIDFHGHSQRKNTFFYGPSWPIHQTQYIISRILPKILSNKTTMFRYYACSFRIQNYKKSTARACFFETYKIPYVYTLQASVSSYYCSQMMATFQFNTILYKNIGNYLTDSLIQFLNILFKFQQQKKIKLKAKKDKQEQNMQKKSNQKIKLKLPEQQYIAFIKAYDLSNLSINQLLDQPKKLLQIDHRSLCDSDAQSASQDLPQQLQNIQLKKYIQISSLNLQSQQLKQNKSKSLVKEKQPKKQRQKSSNHNKKRKIQSSNTQKRTSMPINTTDLDQKLIKNNKEFKKPSAQFKKNYQHVFKDYQLRKSIQQKIKRLKLEQKYSSDRYNGLISIDLRRVQLPQYIKNINQNNQVTKQLSKQITYIRKNSPSRFKNKIDQISKINRMIVPSAFYRMRQHYSQRKKTDKVDDNLCLNIKRVN